MLDLEEILEEIDRLEEEIEGAEEFLEMRPDSEDRDYLIKWIADRDWETIYLF